MNFKNHKTLIIPVTKETDRYIIEVMSPLWNQLQILILKGGVKEETTIEFEIKSKSQ